MIMDDTKHIVPGQPRCTAQLTMETRGDNLPRRPAELCHGNTGWHMQLEKSDISFDLTDKLVISSGANRLEKYKKGHKGEPVCVSWGNVTEGSNIHQVHLNPGSGGTSEGTSRSVNQ